MLGLFDSSLTNPKYVEFVVNDGEIRIKLPVLITLVQREDESGESWNITGLARENRPVTGFYSTKRRTGWLTFE